MFEPVHFTNETITDLETLKNILRKAKQGATVGFWLHGQRFIVETFESWDEHNKQKPIDREHPSVRQLGTIKQINDGRTFFPAMLTNIQINFKHGQRTQVEETWKEVQINKGKQSIINKPRTIKETHFIPDSPHMDITVTERETNDMGTSGHNN